MMGDFILPYAPFDSYAPLADQYLADDPFEEAPQNQEEETEQ